MYAIVFLALLSTGQPHVETAPYSTLTECEIAKAKVVQTVKEHNASTEPVKIVLMATECVELKKAPAGRDV